VTFQARTQTQGTRDHQEDSMAGKTIVAYTTTIDPMKTATECIALLASKGATDIGLTSDGQGTPTGLLFVIATRWGRRQFTVPVDLPRTEKTLQAAARRGKIPPRYATADQSRRVAWRVVLHWLEAQLSLVEIGAQDLEDAMIAYVNVAPGQTLAQYYGEQQLALESAG
jgi:hypothetical protein